MPVRRRIGKLNASISSLFRLFEILEGEVQGRESSQPPPEVEALLLRLLNGDLPSSGERQEAFKLLLQQPGWMAWFADRVKSRRTEPGRADPGTRRSGENV